MSGSGGVRPRSAIVVRVDDAHLEFLVDGEGSYSILLFGAVEASDLDAAPVGMAFDITLSDIDPESYGLMIGADSGGLNYQIEGRQAEGVRTLAGLARGRPGALICTIKLFDEGRPRAGGLFWGGPVLTLTARNILERETSP
ncbi:MAG: hypothetical protein NXI12_15045 [Alphaproteobacteria bacterium]|nr:hypothetical protein [Alphaproteobacteria bacterium]